MSDVRTIGKRHVARRRLLAVLILAIAPLSVWAAGASDTGAATTGDTGEPLTFMVSEHSSITYNEDSAVLNALVERTGVEFEVLVIPSSDYSVKQNAMLASNDLPDILKIDFTSVQAYAGDGLFVNLSDREEDLPNYFAMVEEVRDSLKFFTIEGDYYHFARTSKANPAYLSAPMIREDMVAEVGMEIPESFDELYEVLKAFKRHDPDSIPWSTRGDTFVSRAGYSFGSGNGVYFDESVEGGKYLYAPLHEPYGDFLAYLNKLYAEGLIDPDYNVATSAQWQENMSSGKSYFYYDNTTFATNFNKVLVQDDPAARFVPVLTLKNHYGQRRSEYYPGVGTNSPTRDGFSVSSDSANIGGALILMDYMYSEEGSDLTSWGVEGEHYSVDSSGQKAVAPSLVQEFSDEGDPWRAYQAFLGTGTLAICPYYDNYSSFAFLEPDEIEMYEFWTNDPYSRNFQYLPTLSSEESERLVPLLSSLNTIVTTESSKFVLGLRPLSQLDDFRNDLLDAGGAEVEEIYAAAYARIQ